MSLLSGRPSEPVDNSDNSGTSQDFLLFRHRA